MAITATEIEKIRGKIETLKSKRAKAEGAMESEVATWKKLYDATTIEEMEKLLTEAEEDCETYSSKMETVGEELKGLTNWQLL